MPQSQSVMYFILYVFVFFLQHTLHYQLKIAFYKFNIHIYLLAIQKSDILVHLSTSENVSIFFFCFLSESNYHNFFMFTVTFFIYKEIEFQSSVHAYVCLWHNLSEQKMDSAGQGSIPAKAVSLCTNTVVKGTKPFHQLLIKEQCRLGSLGLVGQLKTVEKTTQNHYFSPPRTVIAIPKENYKEL